MSSQQVMREAGRQAQHLHVVSVQGRTPLQPAGGGGGAARVPRPLGCGLWQQILFRKYLHK